MAQSPGWYPQSDGTQRYWDGQQWTEHTAPSAPQGPPAAPPLAKKKNWFLRHKILTGLGALVLLFIVIGTANGGKSSTPTGSTAASVSSAPSSSASSSRASSAPAAPSSAPAPPAPSSAPASPPPPPPPAAPAETVSQQNAVRKAKDYLDLTAFSRSGLIKQMQFDGFSVADATYGVDKLNADWNEQAAKKAKDYLALTSFSRASLIKQLQFDGFTTQQAEYGVQKVGL